MTGPRRPRALLASVLLLTALGVGVAAAAADLRISADVNRGRLREGEVVRLKVTATGSDVRSAEGPEFPSDFPFEVVSTGTSSSFSWINGKSSQTIEWTFNLLPQKTGKLTIGPIAITRGAERAATDPIRLQVLPAAGGGAATTPSPSVSVPSSKGQGAVFLRTVVAPARAYVGQQIVYTSEIYSYQRFFRRPSHTFPDFVGFVVEEPPERPQARTVNVDGRGYVLEQIQLALFPTKAGTFTLDRPTLSFERDPFFSRSETVVGDPVTIEVLPLPGGAPAGFDGAVGDYEITASVEGKTFTAGKPVTLRVTVRGEGNIKGLREPQRPDLDAFKLYESTSSEKVFSAPAPLAGQKTFEYLLIPPAAGEIEIGAFAFSFFDPASGRYRAAKTDPIRLHVEPSTATAGDTAWSNRPAALSAATDVRPLKLTGDLGTGFRLAPGGPLFFGFLAAPWILTGAVFGARVLRRRVIDNPAVFSAQRLRTRARAGLGRAAKLLDEGRREDFYVEMSAALAAYLAEKCGHGGEALTRAELEPLLQSAGCPESLAREIAALLEEADVAKFAPGALADADARAALGRAEKVVETW
ncbi:MAG: protein BatD [Myxococcales bacterium]|nr:protein BatD [Myxococcales bacterium]